MFDDKGSGIGFLKTTKARHAEEAIGHTEGLVTVLRLTMADIKPAEATLAIAKQFFDAHQYAKAVQAAKRAESIAIKLDERFGQYQKALQGLQSQIGSMKRLGLDTEAIAKVAGKAEEKVVAGISENGAFVPNYLEARDILVRATQEGRAFQEKSEIASNRIFVAELAIESLANLKGASDNGTFAHGAASNLEQTIHAATKELALGNPGNAAEIAKGIEEKARGLKTQFAEATKSLTEIDAKLGDLRSEGVLTHEVETQVKMARDMLDRGLIEPAAAMASRLQDDVKSIAEHYRKASTTLADAEILWPAPTGRVPFLRRRCRAARRPSHDPGRELRPGEPTPRTRVAGLGSADERARRPGEGHRGDTDPGPSARGQWALVLARHPGSPGPRGTRVPPGKLLRLQRGPADRDRPPGRGHTRARPEEANVGLKPVPGVASRAWADSTSRNDPHRREGRPGSRSRFGAVHSSFKRTRACSPARDSTAGRNFSSRRSKWGLVSRSSILDADMA